MSRAKEKIDSALLLKANASIEAQHDIHRDVAVSRWSIDRNSVAYEKSDSHTLSLYLKGGETSYRADQQGNLGRSGTLCLMPQGHASNWHIGGPIDFVHLYFSDAILKRFAADHYEQDVRLVDLRDLIYQADDTLSAMLLGYVDCCTRQPDRAGLMGEHLLMSIFDHIITRYNGFDLKENRLKGGLTPLQMRQVKALIADKLDSRLSMADLAAEAGLSPFHFARQFKESFGETPGQYVMRKRIESVRERLKTEEPLAQIAARTGFAQQSHMTSQFRKQVGLTPLAYRMAMVS
ncbi:AraC family transcriptional regulator [Kordiimonas lacus]|uniref:AraC family transcriptional regulator n=1 Tax=Kordiimonas lacus TaxID=637679 RepID=A0A1G6UP84_9PROT|nr:AraC family transcriptional regulator [Kordiimonas lacus]SDD43093.1 AraC family transcriptional regulator [Kordiimonas lacus]